MRPPLLTAALLHTFQPYPSAPCLCFSLALLGCCCTAALRRHTVHAPLAAVLVLGVLGCLPSLRIGWLERRALNANFFYAATLLLAAAHACLGLDVAAAALGLDARATAHVAAVRAQRAWRRHAVKTKRMQ